jgi:hypothetical protein
MRFTTMAAIVLCAVTTSVPGAEAARGKGKAAVGPKAVTVTGCLERNDNVYRLTGTSGAHAPKARSWKSGFLKKRTSDLEVLDPSRKIKLKDHVGHRDALTGRVEDGELRVQSMRHLAASCGH